VQGVPDDRIRFSRPFAIAHSRRKGAKKSLKIGFDPLGDFAALCEIKVLVL